MADVGVTWAGLGEVHLLASDVPPAACAAALRDACVEGVAEITPGSRTVQLRLKVDAEAERVVEVARAVVERLTRGGSGSGPARVVEVPICSDLDLAPDLEDVAHSAGLSPAAAAALHASAEYTVAFLGFAPGFPYIDGLPAALHHPRLDSPRPRVRTGSVGIAGARTGIYPQASPGGWRVIGATPLRLFDPQRDPPALFAPGDRVRFRCIERDEFDALESGGA